MSKKTGFANMEKGINTYPPDKFISPFRYPGGKGFFAESLAEMVSSLSGKVKRYIEPYAGGSAAALQLLARKKVERILLNDADPRIYAAWYAILEENERFLETLSDVSVNLQTWKRLQKIVGNPRKAKDRFELGFATYFLNRTNRSGILLGAGPIGGYSQSSKWKMDARFYRETMIKRIEWLGKHSDNIFLHNMDGLKFLKWCAQSFEDASTFYFADPPYVGAGSRLYMNGMTEESHRALANFFHSTEITNWAITYDDCDLIREIYSGFSISNLEVNYSLQKKRKVEEVLIRPGPE